MDSGFTRRSFATRLASALSTMGIAGVVLGNKSQAQTSSAQDSGVIEINCIAAVVRK
jgi:hypothetical protein